MTYGCLADIIIAPMVIRLVKLPFMAFTKGHIYGYPITRNPIAWIPFFVVTPVVLVLYLGVCVIGFLLSPIFIIWGSAALYLRKRKVGAFSDKGITFQKAYAGRTIAWSE